MAGRKQVLDQEFELNKQMMELGREEGAREAKQALEAVESVHHLGQIAGRAQAFGAMKLISEFLEWKHISQLINSKEFLKIQGVTSIDDYLDRLGFTRSAAYRNLKIARTLTAEEISLLGQVGFTRKDLLSYASLPDEARIEIREGKVINIEKASRESIKEAIEEVLQEKAQLKEESDKTFKTMERLKGQKQQKIDEHERKIVELEARLEDVGIPRDEAAYCELIDKIEKDFHKSISPKIREMVAGNVPGPIAALRMISMLKRGGIEDITLEAVKNDDVTLIKRIPVKLGRAAARTLYNFCFDLLANNAAIYDTVALFHAAHANIGTSALAKASLQAGRLAMMKQTEAGSAEQLDVPPRFLIVPTDLEDTAYELTAQPNLGGFTPTAPDAVRRQTWEVIAVKNWIDLNNWYLAADPKDIPSIEIAFMGGKDDPEIFIQDHPNAGSMFSNDKITFKIRHVYGGAITDFRGLYGSIVA